MFVIQIATVALNKIWKKMTPVLFENEVVAIDLILAFFMLFSYNGV